MSSREQKNKPDNIKMILIIILSIVVVISALVAIFVNLNNSAGSVPANQSDNTETVLVNETANSKNIEAKITELILNYRKAFATGDIDTLAKIYNTDQVMDADNIIATANIIKGYENTKCYIKEGNEENTYVAFVYDDLNIVDVDTLVPNLTYVYVMQKSDGSYYIYPGEYDTENSRYSFSNEIQSHIGKLIAAEDINNLYTDVNEKFIKLCEENEDLKKFMQKISDISDETRSSEEEPATTETISQTDTGEGN